MGLVMPPKVGTKDYERELRALQIELVKWQQSVIDRGERVIVVFEGRDGAGKGGTIERLRQHLNPRQARVVALTKPTDVEQGQWYFQRYVTHFPTAGKVVCFDRSWYNRAGVERVMGFCTNDDVETFLEQTPPFEAGVVEGGTRLHKLFLDIDREVQQKRLDERREDPLKAWKISPIDEAAIEKYDDYTDARDAMLAATDTPTAPWTGVNANRQKVARLHAIRHLLHVEDYEGKDPKVAAAPDPEIVASARDLFAG